MLLLWLNSLIIIIILRGTDFLARHAAVVVLQVPDFQIGDGSIWTLNLLAPLSACGKQQRPTGHKKGEGEKLRGQIGGLEGDRTPKGKMLAAAKVPV